MFRCFLKRVRLSVDAELRSLLDARLDEARRQSDANEAIVQELFALLLRGGKRLRPALLGAAYLAAGGDDADDVSLAGAALELLQAYLLIHDDWMDDDATRRGGPSVHAALATRFGSAWAGGVSAVLAGDYAVSLAQETLFRLHFPAEVVVDAAREFARMQIEVVSGQMLDVHLEAETRDAVERVYDLKTASYTVRGPLLMGACLGRAAQPLRAGLARLAGPLGVAFQLRDDLLGVFGDATTTGKPVGGDLRRGKKTALIVDGRGAPSARGAIDRVLGVPAAGDADIASALAELERCGARSRAERRIDELLGEALAGLRALTLREPGRTLLEGAVSALGRRER